MKPLSQYTLKELETELALVKNEARKNNIKNEIERRK